MNVDIMPKNKKQLKKQKRLTSEEILEANLQHDLKHGYKAKPPTYYTAYKTGQGLRSNKK